MKINLSDLCRSDDFTIASNLPQNHAADFWITGVYCCDLLSFVMSHAKKGDAWLTILNNINIIAVAVMTEISCIILTEDITLEASILARAEREGVVVIYTKLDAFSVCIKLNELDSRISR